MLQEYTRLRGEVKLFPQSSLQGILYRKQRRSPDHENISALKSFAKKTKKILLIIVYALAFPFIGLYRLFEFLFRTAEHKKHERLPIMQQLVPYYAPRMKINALDADIAAPLRRKGARLSRKEELDRLWKPGKTRVYKKGRAKRTAAALMALAVLAVTAYGSWYWFEGRYKTVVVMDGFRSIKIRTTEETVEEFLIANDLGLSEDDLISCGTDDEITEGFNINITRAKQISIRTMNDKVTIYMPLGTVGDALRKAGIYIDEDDEVFPSLDTEISNFMQINVVGVETKYVTKTEVVPYKFIYQDNSNMYKGTTKVSREGKDGKREITECVTLKNGVEVARVVVKDEVVEKPVHRVIQKGTKPTPKPIYKKGGINPAIAGLPSTPTTEMIKETITAEVTAYTHTGNRTATGKWPQVGMCAIVTDEIPYGTLLYIPGYGYAVAEDCGVRKNPDAYRIDVFMDELEDCIKWGRRRGVQVYIIQRP